MNWLQLYFKELPVSAITAEAFREYLEKPKNQPRARRAAPKVLSAKTWNNRRGLLNTFALYCVEMGYLAENTIAKVPKYKISKSRSTAETLTADQVEALMAFLETYVGPLDRRAKGPQPPGFLFPFFALALFGGIRIEPDVSKVNEKRTLKIQPNLKLWLEKYPIEKYPQIPPRNVDRVLREIRQKFSLGHDVLRHTYISMTVGAFRSVGDASLQAGNSEAIIRKHYLDLKSTEEADLFWNIVPAAASLPELKKQDGRYVAVKG